MYRELGKARCKDMGCLKWFEPFAERKANFAIPSTKQPMLLIS